MRLSCIQFFISLNKKYCTKLLNGSVFAVKVPCFSLKLHSNHVKNIYTVYIIRLVKILCVHK